MMTRDEFDDWLDDHREDALDEVKVKATTLPQWLKITCTKLSQVGGVREVKVVDCADGGAAHSRDDFERWLKEQGSFLDDVSQSETTLAHWISRFRSALTPRIASSSWEIDDEEEPSEIDDDNEDEEEE